MDVTQYFECGVCEHCWVCIAWQEKDFATLNRYFKRTRGESLRDMRAKAEGNGI